MLHIKKELLTNCSISTPILPANMASIAPLQAICSTKSVNQSSIRPSLSKSTFSGTKVCYWTQVANTKRNRPLTVVAAVGDVSSDGNVYLYAGAAAVALLGTAFPILFSRKDL